MIRKADNRDIDDVLRLLVQVNDIHAEIRPDLFVKGHTKYTVGELERIFADSATPVFVDADEKGRILGYCFCVMHDNTDSRHLQRIKTLYSRPLKKHHSSQSTQHYVGCPKGRHSEWPAIGRNVLIKIFSRMEEHPHDS